jgi:hypothetical protein
MANHPIPNPRIVFAERPGDSIPVIGKHIVFDATRTINLDTVPLNGGFLTKTLLLRNAFGLNRH